ncbi:splicing factor, arginine/serine-rich 19-like [Cocos nucifera]|uniref:Splicing factor, arginine/serine-rich 19-like n=1 Tax=Cocos nucifera TaxID=13894 RepID=A0A8K0IVB2_COCNU|nr:splicing factor, arginine/serine-rich 19-like [Cocos nucifera]
MMEEVSVSGNKRCREESLESEAKRLHADFLLDILDDDDEDADAGDRYTDTKDLASVMRSLEEEIFLPLPPPPVPAGSVSELSDPQRLAELGYLLAASDDELGLPPAAPSSSSSSSSPEPVAAAADGEEAAESAGFGQIWSFDDEISGCYDGVGFGIRPEEELQDGSVLDDGLFDYADVLFRAPSDFSWRAESMPAV